MPGVFISSEKLLFAFLVDSYFLGIGIPINVATESGGDPSDGEHGASGRIHQLGGGIHGDGRAVNLQDVAADSRNDYAVALD